MKSKTWSGLITTIKEGQQRRGLPSWMGDKGPSEEGQDKKIQGEAHGGAYADGRPIEPGGKKPGGPSILRWIIFLLLIAYVLISYFRVPLLTHLGEYLVVQDPLKKADLIVCMAGRPVERGLAAAEVYKGGYAPKILIPREEPPEGDEVLKARGIHYPHETELLIEMLQGLGVPRSACITSDHPASSCLEEAKMVKELAVREGYHSIIVVTSPAQTRSTRVIFKNVFDEDDFKIIMTPSRYTNFKADNWWMTDKYLKEVITEYQKLIYYTLKGLW